MSRRTDVRSADWWFADRVHGGRTIGQWPNAALGVFLVTLGLRYVLAGVGAGPDAVAALLLVGRGALLVWGLDELVRGVNPFRRVLGAVVLLWQVVGLVAVLVA